MTTQQIIGIGLIITGVLTIIIYLFFKYKSNISLKPMSKKAIIYTTIGIIAVIGIIILIIVLTKKKSTSPPSPPPPPPTKTEITPDTSVNFTAPTTFLSPNKKYRTWRYGVIDPKNPTSSANWSIAIYEPANKSLSVSIFTNGATGRTLWNNIRFNSGNGSIDFLDMKDNQTTVFNVPLSSLLLDKTPSTNGPFKFYITNDGTFSIIDQSTMKEYILTSPLHV